MRAILFDLDGVLVDAVAIHRQAFLSALLIADVDMTAEEHDRDYNGLPTAVKLNELAQEGRINHADIPAIIENKQRITRNLIERHIRPDPEKRAMLDALVAEGYFLGCVSNAIWTSVTRMLTLANLMEPMEVVISNEDVKRPKPAPDGWLLAMRRLGVTPEETLILEDSIPGRLSAHASGAHVLEVDGPHQVTLERLRAVL